MKTKTPKNTYLMWENGPTITLPDGYHFRQDTQTIHTNDGSWSGSVMDFWNRQNEIYKKSKEAQP